MDYPEVLPPNKQWEIIRKFRRYVKNVFDEKEMEIPFPHLTINIGEGKNTGKLLVEVSINSQDKL